MLTGRCAVKIKQIPALSAGLAICRPCGPQICIRIVWAFYLCYLLWLRILGSRPILGWDCMLTGRCAVKMKQIPALSAELAICRPCGPQICIRIVWAFYLCYLLWLRILGSRPILSWDCMLTGRNNFLRYQLSWLYAGHADPKFVFVLSEPSTCATCCEWAYLAAGPF